MKKVFSDADRAVRARQVIDSLLLDIKDHGIILLVGQTNDRAFEDSEIIHDLRANLEGTEYIEFYDTLSDFHKNGRRRREILIFMLKKFLDHPYAPIIKGVDIKEFSKGLDHRNSGELERFLSRQKQILVTESDGDGNAELYRLFERQLDSGGNKLITLAVPITNLFSKPTNGRSVPMAYVYATKQSKSAE